MIIKPKIEIEHLQHKEYEVIAVNSSALEFYLVQNDKKGFEWYESRFFDKQTIIDQEKLFREELVFEWSYNWVKGFNICQKIF